MAKPKKQRYPAFEAKVGELVREHLLLKDEPLLLAVYYQPERPTDDVFLFEVIEGFGFGSISDDREFFEVGFGTNWAKGAQNRLQLVLTSPQEFERAVAEHWLSLEELRSAMAQGKARVVYRDPEKGKEIEEALHAVHA